MKPSDAIRVMVVGDSISHGREGDWTWRYRIWEWFKQQRVAVRFVGPYPGTSPPEEPRPPRPPPFASDPPDPPPPFRSDGGYAEGVDKEFLANSNHFAVSGRQTHDAKNLVAEQVAAHQPELCLVELGFNDFGWRRSATEHLLADMKHLIDQARSVKPDLKFAVANVPHRTHMPGREDLPASTDAYNDLLAQSIPSWSTPQSPIALVRFCENYSCGGTNSDAAYDGLHPNALGEYQLAQAFSRTLLSTFHLGRTELVIPTTIPPRPLPPPPEFDATPGPGRVVLTWPTVYGAYGYDLQHRVVAATDTAIDPKPEWTFTHVESPLHHLTRLLSHQTIEARVRTAYGSALSSSWTDPVRATAETLTAPAPSNIRTHPTPEGFSMSWTTPPLDEVEVDRYGVIYFDGDAPGSFPVCVGVPAGEDGVETKGLVRGHRYFLAVETWTQWGAGGPAGARAVRVGWPGGGGGGGGGDGVWKPARPKGVGVAVRDEHSVVMGWEEVEGAAGYDVWVRRRDGGGSEGGRRQVLGPMEVEGRKEEDEDGESTRLLATLSDLEPSVWDWEYAVRAYNGDDASDVSEWVTAPRSGVQDVSLAEGDAIHVALRHG